MASQISRKIELPRQILVGDNALEQVGEIAGQLSQGKKALVVAGDQTMQIAGNRTSDILQTAGFEVQTHLAEIANEETVAGAQSAIRETGANIVLGVGGGTAIDIAKLSSARGNVSFISVPTAASHDGMGSPIASIKSETAFTSYPARAPIAIVADIDIIASAPHRMTAAGCADLISNFTAVEDWKLAHRLKGEYFGDYAASLALMSAKMILDNAPAIKKNLRSSIKIIVEGLISSGAAMCISGNSRPCSGAEHLFSHALDRVAEKPAMHGEQCGVGTIMMAYLHKLEWEKLRDALRVVGAPTTAVELGVSEDEVVKALTTAHTIRDRYTILGTKGLTEEAARELAKKTGVLE